MCGRYAASRSPDDLAIEFEAVRADGQTPLPADYNVAPTKDVYVVRHKKERDAVAQRSRPRRNKMIGEILALKARARAEMIEVSGQQDDLLRRYRIAPGQPPHRVPRLRHLSRLDFGFDSQRGALGKF